MKRKVHCTETETATTTPLIVSPGQKFRDLSLYGSQRGKAKRLLRQSLIFQVLILSVDSSHNSPVNGLLTNAINQNEEEKQQKILISLPSEKIHFSGLL